MVGSVSWMGCPQAIETDCACAVGTEACSAADMKSNKMITKNDRRKNSFIEPLERIALFKSNLAGPVTPLTDLLETGQLQGCCLVGLIFQFFQFVRNAILIMGYFVNENGCFAACQSRSSKRNRHWQGGTLKKIIFRDHP